ncbi:MAG: hypothetical protein ACOCRK_05095, partial [bacterium]
ILPISFTIKERKLPPPVVFEPIDNATYFSYIPFVFDMEGIKGQCSNRAYYKIYYKSDTLDIEWQLLYNYIPIINNKEIKLDIEEMFVSDDYQFKIELIDDNMVSEPVFIKNITINSLNYFLIDTKPPRGDVKILNNYDYINFRDIILDLNHFDYSTEVETYKIEQFNVDEDKTYESNYRPISNKAVWSLKGGDGANLVQVRYKDVGNNTITDSMDDAFRTYRSMDNLDVNSLLIHNDDIWMAFGEDSSTLYKNRTKISDLNYIVSSMIIYNNILYFAVKTEKNKGIIKKYDEEDIITIKEFDEIDSNINNMLMHDNKIFLTMDNGKVMSFTDSEINLVYQDEEIDKFYGLSLDSKNNLYLFPVNKNYIIRVNKQDNDYSFIKIEL